MARIWIHEGRKPPVTHPLDGNLLIGRDVSCDLVLDDATVSTDHAEITRRGSGFLISDLDSLNGTLVNGRTIDRATRLSSGDIVQIGPFRLEVDLPRARSTKLRSSPGVELTEEERDVARALVAPYRDRSTFAPRPATQAEIAAVLFISESTVKRRLERIAIKLEIVDRSRERMQAIADRVLALGLDQS